MYICIIYYYNSNIGHLHNSYLILLSRDLSSTYTLEQKSTDHVQLLQFSGL